MADNNLSFKQGLYSNIKKLKPGDFGFAIYNDATTYGTIVIKDNENLVHTMPAPGAPGLPLLGQGENKSPAYGILGIFGGGTGVSSMEDNRLLYINKNKFNSSGHYIDSNLIAINSTTKPAENLYVKGTARFDGDISQKNITGTTAFVYHYSPFYNPTKSSQCIVFNFGAGSASIGGMFCIEIKGHSYKDDQVLHSIYQFYNYKRENPDKSVSIDLIAPSGRCFGVNTGVLYVERDTATDTITAWLLDNNANSTMSISIYTALTSIKPVISYQVSRPSLDRFSDFVSTAYTNKLKIDPRKAALPTEGGTGVSSLTDGALLIGAGTNAIEFVPDVAKGQVLMSNGVNNNPIFGTPSMSWTKGTTYGPVFNYIINDTTIACSAIPTASDTVSGVVAVGDQTFAGNKTFTGKILPQTDLAQNIGSLDKSFYAIYAKALYLKREANSKVNYIVGTEHTDQDYCAILPNHSGNITISINDHYNVGGDGITCFIPFYSTKGEVIQYNNGLQYYTLEGTTTKEGYGMLILGNSTSSGSAGNKRGTLRLYGPNNMYTNVMATTLTKNRRAYIRDYGIDETYFVGVDSNAGKGSETIPIYIADTGLATACSSYAGGTAITLNGTSKAANTASFYAPTSAGTAGYILKSGGTSAPSWIQFVPIANGGTGATSITANRLLYNNGNATSPKIAASSHYISSTKVAINSTSAPSENLYVSGSFKTTGNTTVGGTLGVTGNTTLNGNVTLGNAASDLITVNGYTVLTGAVYGDDLPTTNLTTGRVFFKLI